MIRTVFTGADGAYALPNLPVGPYQLKVVLQGFNTYVRDGIVLQVGSNPEINVTLAVGAISEQVTVTANIDAGRDQEHRRRPGHRQPARHGAAAQRPPGDRADLPLRPRDVGAGRRPQHEQEFPDRHDLGRRRPGQRHHLHHGRRHAQRSVQQPEPADAVSRRAAGVQGRDERAAGALRLPRRVRGEPGDQVRIEPDPRRPVRVQPQLPLHRAQLLRAGARQPEPQPVRRHDGRADRQEQAVRRSAATRAASRRATRRRSISYVPTAAMLDGDFTAFASPACNGGTPAHPDRRLRQQPHRSVAAELGVAELPEARAGLDRSVRQAAVRHPEQQHRAPGAGQGRLHDQLELVAVRALLLRGLRQPGDLRRHQRR